MTGDAYDRYFYGGSDTLINTLGIRDAEELHLVEYRESKLAMPEALNYARSQETLTPETLKGIHKILFGRLYAWAGQWRTMALFKQATAFQAFVSDERMALALERFEREGAATARYVGPFAGELARLWADLNYEHPFVEERTREVRNCNFN